MSFYNSTNMAVMTGTEEGEYFSNSANLVTISAGAGNDTIDTKGDNVIVYAGTGNDSITNRGKSVFIDAGDGDNYVFNNGYYNNNNVRYATIVSGSGNDTIKNYGENNFYEGGDYANNRGGTHATEALIVSGAGDDLVSIASYDSSYRNYSRRSAERPTVIAGAGNDTIKIDSYSAKDSSIYAGTGNDYLEIGNNTYNVFYQYAYGDGDDTIAGFGADDTLQLATSLSFSTTRSGDNVKLSFTSGGSITLTDAAGTLNIVTVSGALSTNLDTTSPATSTVQPVTVPAATPTVQPVTVPAATPTVQPATVPAVDTVSASTGSGTGDTIINVYGGNNNFGTITNTTNTTNITNNYVTFSGGGNQTISDFVTGNGANSNVLYFATSLSSMRRTSSAMTFNASDGSVLQVNNSSAADEMIQYTMDGTNVSYAKVGYAEQNNSFTYQDGVNFYAGGEHTDVLNITNAQSRNIWLDGSAGVGYSGVNNIDASNSSGNNTLAGDASNNEIKAGAGSDSLWGGAGDDVLVGGTGTDEFFFGMNDGNDVAQNVGENDVVNLYDVTLEQITAVNTESNFISINTATGSALQVQNSSSLTNTFKLADGSAWKFNRAAGNWQQA